MTKELSIENIKKALIDKISNNSEILEYFENCIRSSGQENYLKEYGTKAIKDNYIYDYDVSCNGYKDFISVQVDEEECIYYGHNKKEVKTYYSVSIVTLLTNTNMLDSLSMLLGKIVAELYPDRDNYSNRAFNIESKSFSAYKQPARMICFTIK